MKNEKWKKKSDIEGRKKEEEREGRRNLNWRKRKGKK